MQKLVKLIALVAGLGWLLATAVPLPTAGAAPDAMRRRVWFPIARKNPKPAVRAPQPFQLQVVDLVNRERAAKGLAPLRVDDRLMRAAQGHSEDMARNDFCEHIGSDDSSAWDRMRRQGYPMAGGAEVLAAGQESPAEVVAAWKNSSPHWTILMGDFKDIGVGYAFRDGTRYGHFWAADLGVPGGQAKGEATGEEGATGEPPPLIRRMK